MSNFDKMLELKQTDWLDARKEIDSLTAMINLWQERNMQSISEIEELKRMNDRFKQMRENTFLKNQDLDIKNEEQKAKKKK